MTPTIPGAPYRIRSRETGRWVARRGKSTHWHSLLQRAVIVRGGPKLDTLLRSRSDIEAVQVADVTRRKS